ncbi:MAG: UvrD-helicase domain-containing protein, partial [Burkholderiaceae bacterium]|nr:UvrD-helicase domain-containing protein [Burkholderiaceae bacterium]
DAALAQTQTEGERQAAQIMARYAERLAAYQSVDFDDLIALPVRLLQKEEQIAQNWRAKLTHILIDEYQDTNAAQYQLLKLLTGPDGAFTAVGDDDQSIYGWRGATLDNLRQLPGDYPDLKVIKLEQNYRSTNAILRAANHLIAPNPKLYPKRLFSELGEGEPVRVTACDHEAHEAERAVQRLQMLHAAGSRWRDLAILYRANHQAKGFEQALRRVQIPYKVSGGQSFFDRAEIKDLCAWLRLIVNEDDDPAFLRAIATPKRGVGHQTLGQLADFAARGHTSLFGALFAHSLDAALTARAAASLREFGRAINDLQYRAGHACGQAAARALLADWLAAIGYQRHLAEHADSPAQGAARWANVLDFCDWMARRCGGVVEDGIRTAETSLLDVAQTVSLVSTLGERQADADVVTLSTLHAAKGLEWPHVILVGVVEGLLPFKADDDAPETAARIEEERRLMYVGITRARQTLTVSWTRQRKRGREIATNRPSRFIAEMGLDQTPPRADARAQLRALRAEFARRADMNDAR